MSSCYLSQMKEDHTAVKTKPTLYSCVQFYLKPVLVMSGSLRAKTPHSTLLFICMCWVNMKDRGQDYSEAIMESALKMPTARPGSMLDF